jgi:hypothetical protein
MEAKGIRFFMLIGLLVFSFIIPSFADSGAVPTERKELMKELSQARKDFITERDKLHDQDRLLRIAWHNERLSLYEQTRQNPKDKAIKERINAGAKKFFEDKKNVYSQLEQLRTRWLVTRKELGEKIKQAK